MNLPVEVRARGRNCQGLVYDLSPEGCLLGCGPGLIGAGTTVALRFGCGIRLNGRVVLLHGSVARVVFEQPLHDAVLDHLTESQPRHGGRSGFTQPFDAVLRQRAL